jgi:hypothetical protein
MQMFVVGVLGSGNVLGRTFICYSSEACNNALRVLMEANGHDYPDYDPLESACEYIEKDTVYFCGSLEEM